MPALMLDLETLSTRPDAAILSIGAAIFELTGEGTLAELSVNISPESNEQAGRHIDAATVQFWLSRDKAAQEQLLAHQTGLNTALKWLRDFATTHDAQTVWANDPDFDCVILERAQLATKQTWPLRYYNRRSMRTIGALAFPDPQLRREIIDDLRSQGTHHNALSDAVAQVRFVQLAYGMLETGHAFRDTG